MSDEMCNGGRPQRGSDAREERWRKLMCAAQDGDQSAYSEVLAEMLPILRAIVGRRWRNAQDIEDIVQDILLSVHSVRHTYDPARPFLPWLMTISIRRIADSARRVHARSLNETTVENMPETFAGHETKSFQEVSDDRDLVLAALNVLPASQRRAIELMKLQGLSLQEASKQTGKSIASLKVTVHRAMIAMRQALKGEL